MSVRGLDTSKKTASRQRITEAFNGVFVVNSPCVGATPSRASAHTTRGCLKLKGVRENIGCVEAALDLQATGRGQSLGSSYMYHVDENVLFSGWESLCESTTPQALTDTWPLGPSKVTRITD